GVSFVFGLLTIAAYAERLVTIKMMAVWFFIPVLDCVRLLVVRVARGSSPSLPGRDHFHHRMQEAFGAGCCLIVYLRSPRTAPLAVTHDPWRAPTILIGQAFIYFGCTMAARVMRRFEAGAMAPSLIRLSRWTK